jgi:hypothetical protein
MVSEQNLHPEMGRLIAFPDFGTPTSGTSLRNHAFEPDGRQAEKRKNTLAKSAIANSNL